MHPVGFAIVRCDPEPIEFCHTIRRPRIERGGLALRYLLDRTIKLGGRGLIEPRTLFQAEDANGLEKAQWPKRIGIGGVFRSLKTYLNMALGGEVVDLGWLGFLNDADEIRCIGHIAVVQHEPHIPFVRILVEMINALSIER